MGFFGPANSEEEAPRLFGDGEPSKLAPTDIAGGELDLRFHTDLSSTESSSQTLTAAIVSADPLLRPRPEARMCMRVTRKTLENQVLPWAFCKCLFCQGMPSPELT